MFLFDSVIIVSNIKDGYTEVHDQALLELCSKLTVSSIVVSKMKDGYAEVLKQRNARTLFIFDRVIIVSKIKDNNTDVPEKTMLELCSYLTVPLLCRKLKMVIPKYMSN